MAPKLVTNGVEPLESVHDCSTISDRPLSHAPGMLERMQALGLRTLIYPTRNLDEAKRWYGHAFGVAPYFDQPFYVGFEIAGYEL
ncbi:MAG: hypothetical protein M3069_06800, partial [Chloroflexota bacterium]|nr:hypothetical protein [Chloroflexota bacterium]